jgi:hypothetical protein
LKIVILRPGNIRRPERDIAKLKDLWIEFVLHCLLLFDGVGASSDDLLPLRAEKPGTERAEGVEALTRGTR